MNILKENLGEQFPQCTIVPLSPQPASNLEKQWVNIKPESRYFLISESLNHLPSVTPQGLSNKLQGVTLGKWFRDELSLTKAKSF